MQKSGKILLVMLKGSHCTISRALTSNRELKRCFRAKEMNLKDNLTFCGGIVGVGTILQVNWIFHIWDWNWNREASAVKSSCAQIESQQTPTGQIEIYSSGALLEISRNINFNNCRNTHFNCWSSTEEITRNAFMVNSNKK